MSPFVCMRTMKVHTVIHSERSKMSKHEIHPASSILVSLSLTCLFGLSVVLSVGPTLASESGRMSKKACAQDQSVSVIAASCTHKQLTEDTGFNWPM
jgi:hypothetical protein